MNIDEKDQEMVDARIKPYRKVVTRMMRPYIAGENLDYIATGGHTPKTGGMITVDEENPEDMWYLSPEECRGYYMDEPVATIEIWKTRLHAERDGLKDRLTKLTTFMKTRDYGTLSPRSHHLMSRQQSHMISYLSVLDEQIAESEED